MCRNCILEEFQFLRDKGYSTGQSIELITQRKRDFTRHADGEEFDAALEILDDMRPMDGGDW